MWRVMLNRDQVTQPSAEALPDYPWKVSTPYLQSFHAIFRFPSFQVTWRPNWLASWGEQLRPEPIRWLSNSKWSPLTCEASSEEHTYRPIVFVTRACIHTYMYTLYRQSTRPVYYTAKRQVYRMPRSLIGYEGRNYVACIICINLYLACF